MSEPVPTQPKNEDSPKGLVLAICAYLLWGFLPIYMKALSDVPVLEVLAHRVIWSVPVAGAILIWLGRTSDLRAALRSPRMIGLAALTAALISVNWAIYVWSIQSGQALEAALGYYINPLFSVFLGAVLLKERLSRPQWGAIALAALAVLVLTYEAGRVPFVALGLTVSWGIYAYLKKRLPLGPNQGFMLEVLILSPDHQ
jgi:chloramphenicol-sensitive protein RarD